MSRTQDVQQEEDEDKEKAKSEGEICLVHAIQEREEEKKRVSACVWMEKGLHGIEQEVLAAGPTDFQSVPSITLDAKSTRTHKRNDPHPAKAALDI